MVAARDRSLRVRHAGRGPRASTTGGSLRSHRGGFTLVELLVVIAIIGVLVGLLLPAVQAARESARRAQCLNNLKQIGLAMQNFHSAIGQFPHGAYTDQAPIGKATAESWGSAWTVFILPYFEQGALHDRMLFGEGANGASTNNGSGWQNGYNYAVVGAVRVTAYQCPSSMMLQRPTIGNPSFEPPNMSPNIMTNHYAGISGFAVPQIGAQEFDLIGFNEERKAPRAQFGTASAGGVLFAGGRVSIAKVTDGTSNTMMVSEQNDYLFGSNGQEIPASTGLPYGWLIGANKGTPARLDHPLVTGDWRAHQCTTIRYAINQKGPWPFRNEFSQASSDSAVNGVGVIGTNNPLTSAHPGGVNALFGDGSIRFLQDDASLRTLAALATRDDGQANVEGN